MDSKEYWKKREEAQRAKNITAEAEYDAEIQKIYRRMLSSTQKEIDAFYGKYATKEGISMTEAKKRVDKLDIEAYSAKAKKYVANRDLSPQANEEMRLYNLTMKVNRLELLKSNIGMQLVDGFSDLDEKFKKTLTTKTQDELERQAGILGRTVKNPSAMAASIVNASFNNATFSQRIWSHQELLKSELNKQLQSGLISGKNPRDLARSIQSAFGSSTYNAERLMRTELARVQTDAQAQSYDRNGFDEYEFLALGSSACEICRALDGKHFKVKDMLAGENAPPMHPNCRCSTAPYYGDEDELHIFKPDKYEIVEDDKVGKKKK